jgi:hypothetical protein
MDLEETESRNNCTSEGHRQLNRPINRLESSISRSKPEKAKPPRVEAGSNTSTVALRVVGGDEE